MLPGTTDEYVFVAALAAFLLMCCVQTSTSAIHALSTLADALDPANVIGISTVALDVDASTLYAATIPFLHANRTAFAALGLLIAQYAAVPAYLLSIIRCSRSMYAFGATVLAVIPAVNEVPVPMTVA